MIFVAGISIALFISALLLVKKEKSKSDVFLLLWMMLNATQLLFFYLFYSGNIYQFPPLLGLHFPLPLLNGVLLYYYVSSVTNQLPAKKLTFLLHLIPTIITCIYLLPFIFSSSAEKIEVFKNEGQDYAVFQQVLLFTVFLSGIVYVVWSSVLLNKHKKRIRNQFSNLEQINLKWLQFLTYGLGGIWLLVIFTQNDLLIYSGVSIFVMLIGFFGVQQKNIFLHAQPSIEIVQETPTETPEIEKANTEIPSTEKQSTEQATTEQAATEKEKYLNSGLSDELAERKYQSLNELMVDEMLYKRSDLSLSDLASEVGINPNYLSQIINEKEGKSFYDYVNTFRIEEFKRLIVLPENQQFTLMATAYDCGFNSKSSFNRYFKKMTGQTPSQYLKSVAK